LQTRGYSCWQEFVPTGSVYFEKGFGWMAEWEFNVQVFGTPLLTACATSGKSVWLKVFMIGKGGTFCF
jgi:hypothetical protein